MIPLPVRNELGAERTQCACLNCAISCRYVPGFLLPSDLVRLSGSNDLLKMTEWAEAHLLASPGATVLRRDNTGKLHEMNIPTLVPARKPHSTECHWLTPQGECAVHEDAPFACAFFDSHTDPDAQTELSKRALYLLLDESTHPSDYLIIWHHLSSLGKVAPSAKESRLRMLSAIGHLYPPTTPRPNA